MRRVKTALIVDSVVELGPPEVTATRIGTPYGPSSDIKLDHIEDIPIAILTRSSPVSRATGAQASYLADIWALKSLGVERVLAYTSVSSLRDDLELGSIIVPDDFIDLIPLRESTFLEGSMHRRIELSPPYCPELRESSIKACRDNSVAAEEKGTYICFRKLRAETAAEARMLARIGGDILGATATLEGVLARELEMCYAIIALVTNMSAGMERHVSSVEASEFERTIIPTVTKVLVDSVRKMPKRRGCRCLRALEGTRF